MKHLIVAAFLLILCIAPGNALTIKNDHGGMIAIKQIEVLKARKTGEVVRIDGRCDSACTLHLANPKACATSRASLGFHAAGNAAGTRFLWSIYPANVRAYISAHGGLTKRLIVVRGKAAQQLIGAC